MFDAKSLFTSVSHHLALTCVAKALDDDHYNRTRIFKEYLLKKIQDVPEFATFSNTTVSCKNNYQACL